MLQLLCGLKVRFVAVWANHAAGGTDPYTLPIVQLDKQTVTAPWTLLTRIISMAQSPLREVRVATRGLFYMAPPRCLEVSTPPSRFICIGQGKFSRPPHIYMSLTRNIVVGNKTLSRAGEVRPGDPLWPSMSSRLERFARTLAAFHPRRRGLPEGTWIDLSSTLR